MVELVVNDVNYQVIMVQVVIPIQVLVTEQEVTVVIVDILLIIPMAQVLCTVLVWEPNTAPANTVNNMVVVYTVNNMASNMDKIRTVIVSVLFILFLFKYTTMIFLSLWL
jgi:hypothetical protein